jgi:hypothetical protein
MESLISDWIVNQAPVVFVLVLGFVALWRQNAEQQRYLRELLDRCWSELTDCIDDEREKS